MELKNIGYQWRAQHFKGGGIRNHYGLKGDDLKISILRGC